MATIYIRDDEQGKKVVKEVGELSKRAGLHATDFLAGLLAKHGEEQVAAVRSAIMGETVKA
jgi:hypothetical protein